MEICATSLSGRIRSQCVFLTSRQRGGSEKAANQADPGGRSARGESNLLRWEAASETDPIESGPHVRGGHSELDGTALLYMVEEYAEENLSQVLPESAGLTAEEARGMLPPVLRLCNFCTIRVRTCADSAFKCSGQSTIR